MWAVVEIMGHRVRAGLCSDATIAGATFLRIEHPTAKDASGEEPVTEYYAPSSLFAIRPCSFDEAVVAARYWVAQRAPGELPPVLDEFTDDVDVEDDDEIVECAACDGQGCDECNDTGRWAG